MKSILILGGYGNFGKRIVSQLAEQPDVTLLIAGRTPAKAAQLIKALSMTAKAKLEAVELDITNPNLNRHLRLISPYLVIHTSGPFQHQAYDVATCCIEVGVHYIDLADDSDFVAGISQLSYQAKRGRVSIVSGASSVPGLSSAVVSHYADEFRRIDAIDISIAPGNKSERGAATIEAILKGAGKPFEAFNKGEWGASFGWMNVRLKNFGRGIGRRWLANVNVPDVKLFPDKFKVIERVRFQAGLELTVLHLSLYCLAFLARIRCISDLSRYHKPMTWISRLLQVFGTDVGVMEVTIIGKNHQGNDKIVRWQVVARDNKGPEIPTLPALILVNQLLFQEPNYGAGACLSLFTLEEFYPFAESLGLEIKAQTIG